MRRHFPQTRNVQSQHLAHPLPPKPNVLSCLLMSFLCTRHLNSIAHTLLSKCAHCYLHVTLTLILLYRRLKLTSIILRVCEFLWHK